MGAPIPSTDRETPIARFAEEPVEFDIDRSYEQLLSPRHGSLQLESPVVSFVISGHAMARSPENNVIVIFIDAFGRDGSSVELDCSRNKAGSYYFYPLKYVVGGGLFNVELRGDRDICRIDLKVSSWTSIAAERYVELPFVVAPLNEGMSDDASADAPDDLAFDTNFHSFRECLTSLIDATNLTRDHGLREESVCLALNAACRHAAQLAYESRSIPMARAAISASYRLGDLETGIRLAKRFSIASKALTRNYRLDEISEAFGERRSDFAGGRSDGDVLYLLHNCMPFHHGGYAVRAHGLIKGWTSCGENVVPIARLGYPNDRVKTANDIGTQYVVDGVAYNLLPSTAWTADDVDQVAYCKEYARQVLAFVGDRPVKAVVAASFFGNAFAAQLVADRLRAPMAYDMRGMAWLTNRSMNAALPGSELDRKLMQAELHAASRSDIVFCITAQLRQWLVDNGIDGRKTCLMPNGVDPDAFPLKSRSLEKRRSLGYSDENFVLGYVGTVVHYEGMLTLMAAISRIGGEFRERLRLLVVGDGAFLDPAKAATSDFGISDIVHFAGRVPHVEVSQFYDAMDAIVIPREASELSHMISPIKPFEALALGKVTIASDCAAIKAIYEQADCGKIFEAGNSTDLADTICDVAANYDRFVERTRAGRDWVVANRSWRAIAAQTSAFWNGI